MTHKILVIDDDDDLRRSVRAVLEHHGFEVTESTDGLDGATKAHAHLPDLILCDVSMDKADDGYTTLSRLREDAVTAAIPFILMTGMADTAGMRHGMDLGADDYLPKPFNADQLHATVKARLRKVQTVRDEAEKKFSLLRSQISLMLPHEMRTPLNGIISNAELLATAADSLDPKTIAEMSQEICQSGQRLERLIENFLIYAQLQLVATDPQSVSVLRAARTARPAELVRAAARAQAEPAGRLNDLDLDLADAPLPMAEDYLKKITTELVQNALKFSNPGARVRVRLAAADGGIEFSVCDSGRGFSTEQILRIGAYMQFERKMQDMQGFGLGLAIAKKLGELHGGTLTIKRNPESGSTVTLRLPATKPA
jgi:signal transduction histidine kinase